ncbi:MAG TPA: hypothetical protein VKR06_37275 [Ktedonosporobacter sp.]|nr:hypothetical protein [Ktedonosporobacter sp.]
MSTPTPDETCIQAALEQLSKDDLQALIQRMVRQHSDLAELIVPDGQEAVKKPRQPFNADAIDMPSSSYDIIMLNYRGCSGVL